MPKITLSGIPKESMAAIAPRLVRSVAEILDCPQHWISLEWVPSAYFDASGETQHCPMMEIYWFQRPPEIMKATASAISDIFADEGYPHIIIQIMDTLRENYFDITKETT